MSELSHVDSEGRVAMVDTGAMKKVRDDDVRRYSNPYSLRMPK